MLIGNKGEWSEIYTLLKIISDKKLFAGDSDLNKIESLIFPIIKILRDESNGTGELSRYMTYFFTADEHYNHDNVLSFMKRPFNNIEEMNEDIKIESSSR